MNKFFFSQSNRGSIHFIENVSPKAKQVASNTNNDGTRLVGDVSPKAKQELSSAKHEDNTGLSADLSARGQIAIEIIMAVLVIFLLLIFVLIYNNSSLEATSFLKENNLQEIECNKVADAVSLVYGTPGNAELEIFVSSDFNTIGNSLEFGKAYCKSFGINSDNVLQRGFVRISKTNGAITFENV